MCIRDSPYAAQQHKGYGKQVVELMFAYAFGYLHLHRLAIGVVDFNTEALQFYKRVGFQQEGIYEESYYYDFKYHDFIMMRILKQEYLRLYQAECKSRKMCIRDRSMLTANDIYHGWRYYS